MSPEPNPALEPYDPYGNDTQSYMYPLYDIFVPDWYVDNITGEYWVGVAEFSNTTDDEVREGGSFDKLQIGIHYLCKSFPIDIRMCFSSPRFSLTIHLQ